MELIVDRRVDQFVETLTDIDQGRIAGYLDLFRQYQFTLPSKYLKKLDKNLWELRPGNIRLLLGKVGSRIIVVNGLKKKSQKTPKKEIETAKRRLREYQL
jgi:phage-related protein